MRVKEEPGTVAEAQPREELVTEAEGLHLHMSEKGSTGYRGVAYHRGSGRFGVTAYTADGEHRMGGR